LSNLSLACAGECGTIDLFWGEQQTTGTLVSVVCIFFQNGVYRPCSPIGATFGLMPAMLLPNLESITLSQFMPTKPSIWEYLPQPERDQIPPRDRHDRQTWPGYWIYHNRDDSISFGTEERDYFGWLPAEITRAVPESLINTIASMVCHAHRIGRKEAYNFLKQFVLEQMRVPDWPHYPMNDLRKMTPPPLPPTQDT
jgi:hypothetical protein